MVLASGIFCNARDEILFIKSTTRHESSWMDGKLFTVPKVKGVPPVLLTIEHIPDGVTLIPLSNFMCVPSIRSMLVKNVHIWHNTLRRLTSEYGVIAATSLSCSKKLHCGFLQPYFPFPDKCFSAPVPYCFYKLLIIPSSSDLPYWLQFLSVKGVPLSLSKTLNFQLLSLCRSF